MMHWIKDHFFTVRFLLALRRSMKSLLRDAKEAAEAPHPAGAEGKGVAEEKKVELKIALNNMKRETLRRIEAPAWLRAWDLTGRILMKLAEEVRQDGADLLVVSVPIEPLDPSQQKGRLTPIDLKIQEIAESAGAFFYALTPCMRDYLQQHDMDPPYFHFKYDGHFRALGHRVCSECLSVFLTETFVKTSAH
jgi:hypothetical protein